MSDQNIQESPARACSVVGLCYTCDGTGDYGDWYCHDCGGSGVEWDEPFEDEEKAAPKDGLS